MNDYDNNKVQESDSGKVVPKGDSNEALDLPGASKNLLVDDGPQINREIKWHNFDPKAISKYQKRLGLGIVGAVAAILLIVGLGNIYGALAVSMTPTHTPSVTPSEFLKPDTPTNTRTLTPTVTETLTPTASRTYTPTHTKTATPTVSETLTPTASRTFLPTTSVTTCSWSIYSGGKNYFSTKYSGYRCQCTSKSCSCEVKLYEWSGVDQSYYLKSTKIEEYSRNQVNGFIVDYNGSCYP